jgi:Nif-specific regulatory protein
MQVDIRIIAATKRNLTELVHEGKFREDLMYRLSVVQINIPPLRERIEDIPLLAEFFLQKSLGEMGRPAKQFAPDALAKIKAYAWPGNVRQLKHLVESIVALHVGSEIGVNDLPLWLTHSTEHHAAFPANPQNGETVDFKQAMLEFEQNLLTWAYKKAEENQGLAAQLLNIPRSTFQYRWTQLFKNKVN